MELFKKDNGISEDSMLHSVRDKLKLALKLFFKTAALFDFYQLLFVIL